MEAAKPMMRRITNTLLSALLICFVTFAAQAATLSPTLKSKLQQVSNETSVGLVIVAFNTNNGLNATHLNVLRSVGITKGLTLQKLGMVAVTATAGQVKALAANAAVRSIWSNDRLHYLDNEVRTVSGVERARTDAAFTRANGGLPVSGAGDFSVVINDSGIDATHPDLQLGKNVIQNVLIATDSQSNNAVVYTHELDGFTSLQVVENVPDTDLNVGHGTHCAGIVGGTGQQSGGKYAGVAPGAKLIGTGSGAVLFILNALGGFEWSLTNQPIYKIRIISNSYGGNGPFNPDDPVNIATKAAHDANITVVFAAGNSGPGKDTMNPYAKAPWVIGVGAGTKEGGLASFSSRGTPREDRLANSDPYDDGDAPTLVAPGTGREFASNSAKFTAAYVSTRSKSNIFANGLTDDAELSPSYLPYYTQISGTSMATPFIAGTAALMLDANPLLSPDEIKQILTATASRMPGYEEYQVGAGYVNVYAAVDTVFNRSKQYGQAFVPQFNAQFTVSGPDAVKKHVDYSPAGLPGPDSSNAAHFTVDSGMTVLDIFATFDTALEDGEGNTIGLIATAPDGSKYSSGIALPVLDSPSREIVVKNPVAGDWYVEVRGARGLAALPEVSLPTSGAAAPGPVDFTIRQQLFTLTPVSDIQGHPAQAQIETVLKNRMMDTFADNTFRPDTNTTREDLARLLFINTPLRQTLGSAPKFTDVSGDLSAIAEAVTSKGSTLRDYYTANMSQAPAGMMTASGTTFNPSGTVSRMDVAVALVRALGFDAEAKAKAGTPVTVTYSGQTLTLTDNADIPPAMRGYIQFALDRGILQAYFTLEQGPFDLQPTLKARVKPLDPMTRAFMAYALDNYRQHFVAGN
ncbi:MAG: serine protease AprX [Acidobacteriota bacterium]|jgi:serine protease AprX|nr:serine protease AprX [Acidobacteriota bacterium]